MRRQARTLIYDRLHKTGVVICLGLTLYGSILLSNHAYRYFTVVRPQIQAAKVAAEQELLSEGSSDKLLQ